MPNFRVAPDGALLERVAEFTFEDKDRVQKLYQRDRDGYANAIAKLVQTLATSAKIVGKDGPANTVSSGKLKKRLLTAGRLEYLPFFDDERRKKLEEPANEWLIENWDKICSELIDPNSQAESAMIGHLGREFHLFFLQEDSQWSSANYSTSKIFELPKGVLRSLVRPIKELGKEYGVPFKKGQLASWVSQVVTSHFRIFAEYWQYLGNESGDEYMPAFTRSSLRFLSKDSRYGQIETLVMPFVALAAIKKVKNRGDLVERVVEWCDKDGKAIVSGLDDLQTAFRREGEVDQKQRADATQAVLKSKHSRAGVITLNLLKLGLSISKKYIDFEAAKNVADFGVSKSYRWLWQIRDPDVHTHWREELKRLLDR